MITLNTNIASVIARRSLTKSTTLLNQAVERLTTGYKINQAKDNAANYAISTNMTTKINAYQIAEDNCASGLDLISTASDLLELVNDKLNRLRALQEQASNGTYGEESLKAINSEVNAIVDEIERIYNTTEYNGKTLFDNQNNSIGVNMPISTSGEFIKSIERQSTDSLTKLSEVSSTSALADGTYSISTVEELAQLAKMTNDGYISEGDIFILANDIDLAQYCADHEGDGGWTTIGNDTNQFLGTFDGNGYRISNLKINRSGERCQGLFGRTDGNAIIKNLGVINVDITSDKDCSGAVVGGVIFGSNTLIDNCYSTGNIQGYATTGGISGQSGSVSNSYSTCSISCSYAQSGGLVGLLIDNSSIENSYAIGDVTTEGYRSGGLVGEAMTNTTIKNSYAIGNIVSTYTNFISAGGLVGIFSGNKITNCFSLGNLSGLGHNVGGFVGTTTTSYSIIENSYSTGNVNGEHSVGGFIGAVDNNAVTTIKNSYSTGNVNGEKFVGGFVGYTDSTTTSVFEDCYTKGNVGGNTYAAGFLGYMGGASNVTMRNCSVLGSISAPVQTIFLTRNNNSNKGTLVIENCKYNSELNSSDIPLVRSNDSQGNIDITTDDIRAEVSTCGFITPFGLNNDINIGLQVGIDSTQSSRIDITTNLDLSYLNQLRTIGTTDSDLLSVIDHLLNTVVAKQTELGAAQNRLESALEEISTKYENLVSSRSTLRDADVSELSSKYIKQQILQQASATLLATANQTPSIALQLI